MKQYEAAISRGGRALEEAEAQLFPTLTASFGGQRGGGGGGTAAVSSAVGSGAGGSTHTEFTLEGVLSWQPDVWGTIRRQVESRKAGVQVSEANLANARLVGAGDARHGLFRSAGRRFAAQAPHAGGGSRPARPRDHPESAPLRHRDQRRSGGGASRARGDASPADRGRAAARHLRARHRHAHRASAGGIGHRRGAACDHGARGAGDRSVRIAGAQPEHRRRGAADAAGERAHRRGDRRLLPDHQFGCARWVLRQSVVESDQSREPHLVGGGDGERHAVSRRRASRRRGASARDLRSICGQLSTDGALDLPIGRRPAPGAARAAARSRVSIQRRRARANGGGRRTQSVQCGHRRLHYGDYGHPNADRGPGVALTIQQNQLVADVSLIEALGGGWDVSHLK